MTTRQRAGPGGQQHQRSSEPASEPSGDDGGGTLSTVVLRTTQTLTNDPLPLTAKVRFSTENPRSADNEASNTGFTSLHGTGRLPPSGSHDASSPKYNYGRKRGYSLRRSLFAQNVQRQGVKAEPAIEMGWPGPSASPTVMPIDTAAQDKRETTVTVTKPVHDDGDAGIFTPPGPLYQRWLAKQDSRFSALVSMGSRWMRLSGRMFKPQPLPPSPDGRHVRVNSLRAVDTIDERTQKPHIDNTIISCRYTLWNFIPRQLVAQFGKLANFYFLCISILQTIPGLSTTGSYTTIVPLFIFVSISMAKEGYDDLRRHRLDKEENERDVCVLNRRTADTPITSRKHAQSGYLETTSTGWRIEKWQNIRVGDVVLLQRDEPVPADIVLLHVHEPAESAYIETKSLDGETNLKRKKPLADVSCRCEDLDSVADLTADFVVEDPNLDLYKFDGRLSVGGLTLPLTNDEVVYRGSVLRNTPSALGLVIYSGEECKIRMNANKTPRIKAPTLQGVVNKVVIFVAALVFFIGFILTGLYQVWKRTTEDKSWYLAAARVPFGHVLTSFVIMFNTMLPLSLYVSLEIIKLAQMFLMNDIDMYDPDSDTPMEPHTSTINEELGQVNYIFSDKTGTLTNNSMKFRKMSVGGTAWLHDMDLLEEPLNDPKRPKLLHKKRGEKAKAKAKAKGGDSRIEAGRKSTVPANGSSTQATEWKSSTRTADSLHCGKTEQLLDYLLHKPHSAYARKAKFFILALALCHTCIPEKDEEGDVTFQAASPDELALVTAAQDLGYIVTDRQSKSITIKTFPTGDDGDPVYEVYEVLDIIEFSSARKRMSIMIRLPDQRLCLLTKGADTTIRKLLRLAELADASASIVQRRASRRKSLEAQEVLRRRSTQLQTGSRKSRSSISMPEGSRLGRNSSVSLGGGRSARESVDLWLKERESEMGPSIPRRSSSYYTPRHSVQPSTPRPSRLRDVRQLLNRSESISESLYDCDADELIDEAVAVSDTATFEYCFQHIDDFATEGLRTLLYGYRFVSADEYKEWQEIYSSASTSLINRQEKIESAGELIETNLELLGATAIEDKLQIGVPDAIERFRRAGIKMWMLTGDKRETAVNIGLSCRLIKDYSTVVVLDHEQGELQDRMREAAAAGSDKQIAHSVVVIDGQTLTVIETKPALKAIFTEVVISADSVICCRASPSQKAHLVKNIRTKVKGSVTLAIGDGANDIAMIQEAHVGIGIAGKEGLQAARVSDYSISQFRHMPKLILCHGHWCYIRICKYTLATFWKEMFFYLVQAMYQRWNGYTGTSLYEPWSLSMFNTLFTSLPVIFMGVFEKDLAAATLLAVPELYGIGQRNEGFNFKLYAWWASMGAAEAVIVFFIMHNIYGDALFTRDNQLFAMGCLAYSTCIIVISLKIQVIELYNKSIAAAIAILLSVGGWWMWNLALSGFYNTNDPVYNVNHGIIDRFGRNPLWWLTLVLGVSAVLLLEVSVKSLRTAIRPSDVDTFQALEHDIEVRKRFEEAASDFLQQGWQRGTKKSSLDLEREAQEQAEREAQVQHLLERPRTIDGTAPVPQIRRRHSAPADDGEGGAAQAGKRGEQDVTLRSADISELFSRGFGSVKKGQELK